MLKEQTIEEILSKLGLLKLLDNINEVLLHCDQQGFTPRQSVEHVLKLALAKKRGNKSEMLLKMARFPWPHTLEGYDFKKVRVNEAKIRELADCCWISGGDNILFTGASGLGKTHLAVALGRRATAKGYSTIYLHANTFFERAKEADIRGTLNQYLKTLQRNQLVIIDDIGHMDVRHDYSAIFYDFLDHRYQKRTSTFIVTNLPSKEWLESLGNPVTIKAAFDRFIERAHRVKFSGSSYRLEQFKKRNGSDDEEIGDEQG